MTQFIRKSVPVDAWQWEPADRDAAIPDWVRAHRTAGLLHTVGAIDGATPRIHLEALTAANVFVRMDPGDWLIRDAAGDIDVVAAEVFVDAYEAVS